MYAPVTTIFSYFSHSLTKVLSVSSFQGSLTLIELLTMAGLFWKFYCSARLLNSLFDFSCFPPSEITDQCTTVYKADPILAQSSALSLQSIKLFSN